MSVRCPYDLCDGSGFLTDEETRTAYDCRCRAAKIARARANSLSGTIPRRYRDLAFSRAPITEIDPTVVSAVRQYVDNLEANLDAGRGLWLMGPCGTYKTSLAMLVSKTVSEHGYGVAIYSLPRLLAEIRETFGEGKRSYLELLDRLTTVDLLHIDDLGAEKTSPWVLEQLYSVVNARYEEKRSLVVTTNLNPSELNDQITERTVSRITEMCGDPLPLGGPDRRVEVQVPKFLARRSNTADNSQADPTVEPVPLEERR